MNLLILTSIILSVILGVGRMVDLALFTDAETGLCVVGSVWLRYAALAVAILAALQLLFFEPQNRRPESCAAPVSPPV